MSRGSRDMRGTNEASSRDDGQDTALAKGPAGLTRSSSARPRLGRRRRTTARSGSWEERVAGGSEFAVDAMLASPATSDGRKRMDGSAACALEVDWDYDNREDDVDHGYDARLDLDVHTRGRP
jgi:hypothetical protein